MAERYLILCGGASCTAARRTWRDATRHEFRIGKGRDDVHVLIQRMFRRMGSKPADIETDLLEIASFVYAADQYIRRGGEREFEYGLRWRRHFRFEIPVRRPAFWQRTAVTEALAGALGFLSDDDYEFGFSKHPKPPDLRNYLFAEASLDPKTHGYSDVILFSGGLDSLAGAIREILLGQRRVVLASHRPVSKIFSRQCDLIRGINVRLANRELKPLHVAFEVNKGKRRGRDFNQRSRSFLFATFAAVVARNFGLSRIRFFENGVTSLNLPFGAHVLGGRASRTTHPKTLDAFERLFGELFGGEFLVENPFRWNTKAELLREVKASGHGDLCARSCSCSHTWQSSIQYPHCGTCSQCVDRRLTALAAGLGVAEDPPASYESDVLVGPRGGASLTLVERYYANALRMRDIPGPAEFMRAFPEVARALTGRGLTPAEAARRCFELCRRHSDDVLNALAREVADRSIDIVRRDVRPDTLLGLVVGPAPASDMLASRSAASPAGFEVDQDRYEARWGSNPPCRFRNTYDFWVLLRLNERRGKFVTIDELARLVWEDDVEKSTVQRTISNLRRRLREAGFTSVTIESGRNSYRLNASVPAASPLVAANATI